MSRVEIMEFPYNAFLEVRLEFVLLRDDELQAKIMRIIESWMIDQKKAWLNDCAQAASDGKPEPPEPDYFVTLSYAQIIAQLYMFNSSRKGKGKEIVQGKRNSIHRNTITKAMASLIEDNYIITRPNPDKTKEYDATQYKLNIDLIQEHMRLLPKNAMSYLGSNGRIDDIPCHDFLNPPKEIPCTKFVHGSKDAQKNDTPCTKNVHPSHGKSASPSTKKVHGDAQKSGNLIDIENRSSNRMDDRKNIMTPTVSSPSPDSLTRSSTPSLSVDNSPSDVDKPVEPAFSLIANGSTSETSTETSEPKQEQKLVEPMTTRITSTSSNAKSSTAQVNTDPLKLTDEELRIQGYWCQLGFTKRPSAKKHWAKLSEHIKSFEDFDSLFKYVESEILKDPTFSSKTVNPGNLVYDKFLDGWKQELARAKQASTPKEEKKMTVKDWGMRPLSSIGRR
jgi:hypothetical protein